MTPKPSVLSSTAGHRQIATSAVWVAGFVLVAKAVAAAKEMAVASRYGVSEVVDAYQVASTLMLWLPGALGAAMTVVLIPAFVSLRTDTNVRREFLAELQGVSLTVGLFVAIATLAVTPFILPLIATGMGERTREYVWDFALGMIVPAALVPLVALHSARLMAEHRQWNTLLEGTPALAILLLVLFWPGSGLLAPLLLGTLFGYLLQAMALNFLADRQDAFHAGYRVSMRNPQWAESKNMLGMMLLGQFLMSWVAPIDMAAAVKIGEGAVAQLGYAERVLSLLLGVGAMAISRAVLPVFSEVAAHGDWLRLRRMALQWGSFMAASGLLLAALMWWCAPWMIRLLFERGAFSAEDTVAVTEVFRWGLTRLPFYFAGLVFFQLLASQRGFGSIAVVALTCALSKYLLNEYFVSSMGVSGINLAGGLMYAWSAIWLLVGGLWAINRKQACG